jgi:type IV pilus assembly protein PilC
MSTWRYKARDAKTLRIQSSVIQADTDAAARAALRKAGLRPIAVKPVRSARSVDWPISEILNRHLRSRRVHRKADFYDSLSILLESGIPLTVAVRTMGQSRKGSKRMVELTHAIADGLQDGRRLGECMEDHPDWFDAAELAMIDAGQRTGEMDSILRRLAERQSRSGELSSKLVGAMSYPLLVSVIGIGVTLFLSVKTLPELVEILHDAQIEPPVLTMGVMRIGQFVSGYAFWLLPAMVLMPLVVYAVLRMLPHDVRQRIRRMFTRLIPAVFRKTKSAETMLSLSELLKTGVPLVESIRVVAPTVRGVHGILLANSLQHSAERIEQGEPIMCLFDDEQWFSEEHRQMMQAGEAAGELPRTLARIGELDLRAARRMLDRLASLLEPVAIVLLAVLVGTVVMAAVLPLIRLQELVG